MSAKILKQIAIDEANYSALQNLGKAGQSFNDVVSELLRKVGGNQK